MTRYEQRQARADREFQQLTAKSLEERKAEDYFHSFPQNPDGTRPLEHPCYRSPEDFNDLMIPMNTRSPLK